MSLQFVWSAQGNKRPPATKTVPSLSPTGKRLKPSKLSKIPVSSRSNIKSSLEKEKREVSSTTGAMSVHALQDFQCSENKSKATGIVGNKGFVKREEQSETDDVFVWKSVKAKDEILVNKAEEKLYGKTQISWAISADATAGYGKMCGIGKADLERGDMEEDGDVLGGYLNVACTAKMCVNTEGSTRQECLECIQKAKELDNCRVEVKRLGNEEDLRQMIETRRKDQLELFYDLLSDNATFSGSFEKNGVNCANVESCVKLLSPKLGERRMKNKENSQRNGRVSGIQRIPNAFRNGSDLANDNERDEIAKLRAQVEKLSNFVETSEDLRERSQLLLTQQKNELEKEVREKEVLKNKVCCLDEIRRNLQRQLDDLIEEIKTLKDSVRNMEGKLLDERENVKVIKKECAFEVSKNAELEAALQTVFEELLNKDCGEIVPRVGTANGYTKCRVDYEAEEDWVRERNQFVGKMKLLEMDKTKLRSHINFLEETIVDHERIGFNLRENNDVLEFRITELECEVLELHAKLK